MLDNGFHPMRFLSARPKERSRRVTDPAPVVFA